MDYAFSLKVYNFLSNYFFDFLTQISRDGAELVGLRLDENGNLFKLKVHLK